jgi:glycine cleavage system H protein
MKYTKDHEWVVLDGDIASIGITAHAKDALGDLVFLELPDIGRNIAKGDDFAVIESVKAASEVYTPVSGDVTAVNDALADNLDDLGEDLGAGWIVKIKMRDTSELDGLMDKAAYGSYLEGLG